MAEAEEVAEEVAVVVVVADAEVVTKVRAATQGKEREVHCIQLIFLRSVVH